MLSYAFRKVGLIVLLLGIIAAILFFYMGYKPGFFQIKVFAIYSQYFATSYFKLINNDIREEITFLLLLSGELMIIFSKKKKELEIFQQLRLIAAKYSLLLNTFLLIFCTIFLYGLAFAGVMIINCFSLMLIFIITFEILVFKNRIPKDRA